MSPVFSQPEYLHVLVNPVLTHALPLGILVLIFAFVLRSRKAMVVALAFVFLSAGAVIPTVHYGHAGADRIEAVADGAGGQWLKIHQYRAEWLAWLFIVTAVAAAAGLATVWKWQRVGRILASVALAFGIAASAVSGYIAWPAGKIRHREFRDGPPPAEEVKQAEDALAVP